MKFNLKRKRSATMSENRGVEKFRGYELICPKCRRDFLNQKLICKGCGTRYELIEGEP